MTDADPSPEALAQRLRAPGYGRAPSRYALLRVVLLRGIALIYLIGFLVLAFQLRPLVGEHGLLPARDYLSRIEQALGSRWAGFWRLPTLFWLGVSDATLEFAAWLGCALSLVVLSGFANSALMFALWALYLSFVHVGQIKNLGPAGHEAIA